MRRERGREGRGGADGGGGGAALGGCLSSPGMVRGYAEGLLYPPPRGRGDAGRDAAGQGGGLGMRCGGGTRGAAPVEVSSPPHLHLHLSRARPWQR